MMRGKADGPNRELRARSPISCPAGQNCRSSEAKPAAHTPGGAGGGGTKCGGAGNRSAQRPDELQRKYTSSSSSSSGAQVHSPASLQSAQWYSMTGCSRLGPALTKPRCSGRASARPQLSSRNGSLASTLAAASSTKGPIIAAAHCSVFQPSIDSRSTRVINR